MATVMSVATPQHPNTSPNGGVTLRVLVAETGIIFRITLPPAELTVANLRAHLAAAVPPSDQILLLGPPYKVPKDSTLRNEEILNALRLGDIEDDPIPEEPTTTPAPAPADATTEATTTTTTTNRILSATERSGARRLFLFSKRALSESTPAPTHVCSLEPKELKLPTEAPGPSPLGIDMASSTATLPPLQQALAAYERQFMLYLAQGRVLADGADLRLSACRSCVQEQAVIARALRAAVSNLSDHYHTATRTRAEFTTSFQSKLAAHANLLQTFESNLTHLGTIHLHSSLKNVARSSGRVLETLLDTVPVEKERAWAQQCGLGHERLAALFGELETAFGDLGTTSTREEEASKDREAEDKVQMLWNEVEGSMRRVRDTQSQRLERLTADHSEVVKIVMQALHSDEEDKTQAAIGPLGDKSKASKEVVSAMAKDDATLQEIMQRVEQAKTRAMQRMGARLKEISRTQSNIQRVLTNVGVVRDAMTQQMENMAHLEHLAELPDSYRAFLSEVRRRLAYGHAVNSLSRAMVERLATMRTDEVRAREKFLRGAGRHLMPVFFDLFAPTLATPPPLFTPQMPAMVELDTLPHVGEADSAVGVGTVEMGDAGALADTEMQALADPGGVSTASSLTAESHPPSGQHQSQTTTTHHSSSASRGDPMVASAVAPSRTAGVVLSEQEQKAGVEQPQQPAAAQPVQQQEQLIVSADEHSGNDIIVDPAEGAAVDAEVKTLAYENAVLRQTIERMGGKAPQTYLEEAAAERNKSSGSTAVAAANVGSGNAAALELAALRKELAEAKAQNKATEESLQRAQNEYQKLAEGDKISHRSFDVGDVGLFMLASRSGGKRTYLAFHTNCPHRYLSMDCVNGEPNFVVGRIVLQEELVAGEVGTDANPYGLAVGTKFYVVTAEVLSSY